MSPGTNSFVAKVLLVGERVQLHLGVVCLLGIIGSITGGVVFRYVLGNPLTWPEELATLLFIWLAFMGASVAAARRQHIVVDTLSAKFQGVTKTAARIAIDLLITTFTLVTAISAIMLMPSLRVHRSVALDIPRYLYYVPVLFSSAYLFILYANRFVGDLRRLRRPTSNWE